MRHSTIVTRAEQSSLAAHFFGKNMSGARALLVVLDRYATAHTDAAVYRSMPADFGPRLHERVVLSQAAPWARAALQAGLRLCILDLPGAGQSDGAWHTPFSEAEGESVLAALDALSRHPLCNGSLLIAGHSYGAGLALRLASRLPEAVRGVLLEAPPIALRRSLTEAGVVRTPVVRKWIDGLTEADRMRDLWPMDEAPRGHDPSASRIRTDSAGLIARLESGEADDLLPTDRYGGPSGLLISGWHDLWVRDALSFALANADRMRSIIGPWGHDSGPGPRPTRERLRYIEEALGAPSVAARTGVALGIGKADGSERWLEVGDAMPETGTAELFPCAGGRLRVTPEDAREFVFTVDQDATTGPNSRWMAACGEEFSADFAVENGMAVWEMADPEGVVLGAPRVEVALSRTACKGALVGFLYWRDAEGRAALLTEGLGAVPADGTRIHIEMHPTGFDLSGASAVGLAIAGADAGNLPPLWRSGQRLRLMLGERSKLTLPLLRERGNG